MQYFFLKKIKNFFLKETAPEKIRGLETFDLNIFYQIEGKKVKKALQKKRAPLEY